MASPPITLLHGVGLSPTLFADVVDELVGAAGPASRVRSPLRAAYRCDGTTTPGSFDDLVDDVASIVAGVVATAGPTVLVGVSGGATLALAAAIRGLDGVLAVVAHEPLVGPLAPALHLQVSAGADALAADVPGTSLRARVDAFLSRLAGVEVWSSLPHEVHEFAARHADAVGCEVPMFVGFVPSADELAAVTVPVTVTTGKASGPARHEAAAVLAELLPTGHGHHCATIPGASHLAMWQRPSAFADVIRERCHRVREVSR